MALKDLQSIIKMEGEISDYEIILRAKNKY